MSPKFVSIPAAAEHVDVSAETIRRYIRQGRITGYRLGKRLIRVDLDELDAALRPIGDVSGGNHAA